MVTLFELLTELLTGSVVGPSDLTSDRVLEKTVVGCVARVEGNDSTESIEKKAEARLGVEKIRIMALSP